MQTQTSIRKNFIFNSIYQITRIIIPIITTPYLTRILGAEGIGIYSYAISVAAYYMLFIKLGLNTFGKREIAFARDNRGKVSEVFWNIYCMQFVLLVVFSSIYICYCVCIAEERKLAFIMVPYVVSAGLDITWLFWGLEQFKTTTIRDLFVKVVSTILIFALVRKEEDTWMYALIVSSSFLISQIILWVGLRKYVDFIKPQKKYVCKYIIPNLILFIPSVAVSIYKLMDKVMLGILSSKVEVGIYESSDKIVQIPMALIDSLGAVMLPRMSNIVKKTGFVNEAKKNFRYSLFFVMIISTILCFGIMSVADIFVPLFYGGGFDKCVQIYYIILPSCIFSAFANVIRTQYLIPKEMDKKYIISLLSGAGANIIINLLFIPRMGSYGAAIGTLAAETIVCIIQVWFVRNDLPMKLYVVDVIPFVISGFFMYIISFTFNQLLGKTFADLLVKVLLCGIVYCLLLVSFSPIIKKWLKK